MEVQGETRVGRRHGTIAGRKALAGQGRREVISRHRAKDYAVEAALEIVRRLSVEHTIHLSDATIGEKNSHGNDPFAPKDSK